MKDTPDIPNDLKELFRQVAETEKEESSISSAVKSTTDKNEKIPNITNSRAASYSDRTILNETIKKTARQHGTVEDESWLLSYNVRKDLGKVSFGKHEIDYGFGDLNMPGFEKGFDELKENLTVMWCGARGYEDEIPVAFCIYKDNHGRLRAYIPTHGNVWNYFSKGSYEIDDMPDYSYDMKLMREDACKRIAVDPKTIPQEVLAAKSNVTFVPASNFG